MRRHYDSLSLFTDVERMQEAKKIEGTHDLLVLRHQVLVWKTR